MATPLMASVSEETLVVKDRRRSLRSSRPSPFNRPAQAKGMRRTSSRMSVARSNRASSSIAGSKIFRTRPDAVKATPGPSTASRLTVTSSPLPVRSTFRAPIGVRPRRGDMKLLVSAVARMEKSAPFWVT